MSSVPVCSIAGCPGRRSIPLPFPVHLPGMFYKKPYWQFLPAGVYPVPAAVGKG